LGLRRTGSITFPSQLSGGEQQRVAIARAIASGRTSCCATNRRAHYDYATGKVVLQAIVAHQSRTRHHLRS